MINDIFIFGLQQSTTNQKSYFSLSKWIHINYKYVQYGVTRLFFSFLKLSIVNGSLFRVSRYIWIHRHVPCDSIFSTIICNVKWLRNGRRRIRRQKRITWLIDWNESVITSSKRLSDVEILLLLNWRNMSLQILRYVFMSNVEDVLLCLNGEIIAIRLISGCY